MNKNELVTKIVKSINITKYDALKFMDTFVEVIGEELKKENGKVTLVDFGTFKTTLKKQKKGRNPRTGAEVIIPKKRVVRFSSANKLKASVYEHFDFKIKIGQVKGDIQLVEEIINSISEKIDIAESGIIDNEITECDTHGTGDGPDIKII